MEKNEVLSRYFGYDEFRPGQEELCPAISDMTNFAPGRRN